MAILEFARVNGTRYELADKQSREALETKAEIDGYYEDMTVGDSEQLVSTKYVEDSAPYKYRTTGGSADVGNRAYLEKIVGGSVVWNQLAQTTLSRTHNGIAFAPQNDGYLLNGTATDKAYMVLFENASFVSGHRYLLIDDGDLSTYGFWVNTEFSVNRHAYFTTGGNLTLTVKSGVTVTNLKLHPQLFDLTQMFGTAIADYIYSLEQANTGAGVAWFRKLFPNDYYEYNAGELISVEGLQSRKTVGFNLWDEEWEVGKLKYLSDGSNDPSTTNIRSKNYIKVLPTAYYWKAPINNVVCCYDANKVFIEAKFYNANEVMNLAQVPNVKYIRFYCGSNYGTTYNNDICINLSWSGTRDGEYAPYESHEYPLDSSLTLRGIPKLVDSEVKWNGDEYTPEGKVNRKYGIVDLGTLTWVRGATNQFSVPLRGAMAYKVGTLNFFCKIPFAGHVGWSSFSASTQQYAIHFDSNGSVYIRDTDYDDATAFKTAMSGVMLVYELATPTEEEAEPFTEVQIVNDCGTEEFISDSIVPVGHETRYPANLRDKLQHLPDLASGDGNYLIEQNGSQMTLVPFRIPKAPTEDGTYVLKATVSGGTPTYTWEAEE